MTRSSLGGTLSPSAFGFAAGPGIEDLEFQPDRAGSRLYVGPQDLGACCIGDRLAMLPSDGRTLLRASCEEIRPPASPAAARAPRAVTQPRRRAARWTRVAVCWTWGFLLPRAPPVYCTPTCRGEAEKSLGQSW